MAGKNKVAETGNAQVKYFKIVLKNSSCVNGMCILSLVVWNFGPKIFYFSLLDFYWSVSALKKKDDATGECLAFLHDKLLPNGSLITATLLMCFSIDHSHTTRQAIKLLLSRTKFKQQNVKTASRVDACARKRVWPTCSVKTQATIAARWEGTRGCKPLLKHNSVISLARSLRHSSALSSGQCATSANHSERRGSAGGWERGTSFRIHSCHWGHLLWLSKARVSLGEATK